MNRRRRAAATALALVALGLTPPPVAAHAIGGTFELPVPLWLYLAGAASAVAASFGVVTLAGRRPRARFPARPARIPPSIARAASWLLRPLGLVWWYGAIAVGFVISDISPLPAVLLWVGIWIALPIVAALVGNPWPSLSPFRTTLDGMDGLTSRAGVPLDLGLRYPRGLARWPAVVLLGGALWAELILPGGALAVTVAGIMTAYTLVTILGALAFGRAAWLRNAELFEILLGWYGRIGPIRRRSVRGWFAGLRITRGLGWSDAAFVVLLLSGITYDGLRETAVGAAVLAALLPPIQAAFGLTVTSFLLVDTIALGALYATFLAAFAAVVTATRLATRTDSGGMGHTAGAYAAALVPIAAGYLVAHYLTLVVQAVVWLPSLVADPLMSLAPDIGWIPIGFVWYLSVAAIVGGHVAGVALAHRLTLRRAPATQVRAGLPMVLLMIGYTVLSLWIIAQPIVVEPDTGPPEAGVWARAA